MRKTILILPALAMLLIASCSKNESEPTSEEPTTSNGCTVKSVEFTEFDSETGNPYSVMDYYTYDNLGRVTRLEKGRKKYSDFDTFTYTSDKITMKSERIYNEGGKLIETYSHLLDANGRISSYTVADSISDSKYNAEGYLIESKVSRVIGKTDTRTLVGTYTYTYTNGNLTKVYRESASLYSTSGTYNIIISYNNDELKDNNILYSYLFTYKNVYPYVGYLMAFTGKKSKNLVSKMVLTRNDGSTRTVNYTYQKDAKNNVTSVKIAELSSYSDGSSYTPDEYEYEFTYNCP